MSPADLANYSPPEVGHGLGIQLDELPVTIENNYNNFQQGNVVAIEPKIIKPKIIKPKIIKPKIIKPKIIKPKIIKPKIIKPKIIKPKIIKPKIIKPKIIKPKIIKPKIIKPKIIKPKIINKQHGDGEENIYYISKNGTENLTPAKDYL